MFASQLRTEFDLSHGQFGSVYMLGTLASAITLVFIGKVVDFHSVRNVTTVVIVSLAIACASMACGDDSDGALVCGRARSGCIHYTYGSSIGRGSIAIHHCDGARLSRLAANLVGNGARLTVSGVTDDIGLFPARSTTIW